MKAKLLNEFTYKDGAKIYAVAVIADLAWQFLLGIIVAVTQNTSLLEVDWLSMLLSLAIQLIFLGVIVGYCVVKRVRPTYGIKATHPVNYALAALVSVVSLVGFYLTALAFDMLLDAAGYSAADPFVFETTAAKVIGVIATCIAAPICEELIFRGALLSGLKKNFKEPVAVVLSGLAFALMHMNPEQTVYQFLLGCALALMVVKTGSLLMGMIGHCVSNLIAMLMELIPPFGSGVESALTSLVSIPWLAAVLGVVLFAAAAVALFYIGKLSGRLQERFEKKRAAKKGGASAKENQNVPAAETAVGDAEAGKIEAGKAWAGAAETGGAEQGAKGQTPVFADREKESLLKSMSSGKLFLIVGMGICAAMWVVMLIVGVIPMPEL